MIKNPIEIKQIKDLHELPVTMKFLVGSALLIITLLFWDTFLPLAKAALVFATVVGLSFLVNLNQLYQPFSNTKKFLKSIKILNKSNRKNWKRFQVRQFWMQICAKAFPGQRGIVIFKSPKEIARKLKKFMPSAIAIELLWIYWEYCSLEIKKIKVKSKRKFALCEIYVDKRYCLELKIEKLTYFAGKGNSDWNSYVVLETCGSHAIEPKSEMVVTFRGWETLFLKKVISYECSDDGSFEFFGRTINIKGRSFKRERLEGKRLFVVSTWFNFSELSGDFYSIFNEITTSPVTEESTAKLIALLSSLPKPDNALIGSDNN